MLWSLNIHKNNIINGNLIVVILTYLSGHYNHFLVLASSSMLLQFDLFRDSVLQSFTFKLFRFDSTASFHLPLGLPALLVPSGCPLSIFKGTRSSSIRST